ncbi:MAG: hypothetical protein WAW92_01275 [Minisyncoccia bacterium]
MIESPEGSSQNESVDLSESASQPVEPDLSDTGSSAKEFKFYQDRFAGMAERHNNRKGWEKLVDKHVLENDKKSRPKKVSKEYVMQEQAERENADLNRRMDLERREWDEALKPVIEAFKGRRDSVEMEGKPKRLLIYALGGGLRGPYGAGQVIALNEMGITADKVDVLVGSSAGEDDLIYYADGPESTYRGTSIYYEECTTKEFVDVRPKRISQIMNVTVVENAMRKGKKAINEDRIRNLPTEIYALATPVNGAEAELINVKTAVGESGELDMISAVKASMNVRLLRAPGTMVNGKLMEDGSFGSLQLQKLIDEFEPTDILVLPNIPFRNLEEFKESSSWLEHLPNSTSIGTFKKFAKISGELRKMMEEFKKTQGVNIGVLWPPDRGLDVLDQDPDSIKLAVVDTVRDTIRQFGEKQPEEVHLYESEEYQSQAA